MLIMQGYFKFFVFGLVFTGFGLGFLLIGAYRTDLTCARVDYDQVNCTIQSSWLGYFPQPPRTALDVTEAYVQETCDSDGCTYRVEFATPSEYVPLNNVYSSGYSDKDATANAINNFILGSSTDELSMRTDLGMGWFILIPVLFTLIGLFVLAVTIGRFLAHLLSWDKNL